MVHVCYLNETQIDILQSSNIYWNKRFLDSCGKEIITTCGERSCSTDDFINEFVNIVRDKTKHVIKWNINPVILGNAEWVFLYKSRLLDIPIFMAFDFDVVHSAIKISAFRLGSKKDEKRLNQQIKKSGP